jgi:hypothetical protein
MGWLVLRLAFLSIFAKNTHMIHIIYIYLMINCFIAGIWFVEYDDDSLVRYILSCMFLVAFGIPFAIVLFFIKKYKLGKSLEMLYNVIKDTFMLTFNKGYFTATERRVAFMKDNLEHCIQLRLNSKKFIDKWFIWNSNRLKKIISDYEIRTRHTTK